MLQKDVTGKEKHTTCLLQGGVNELDASIMGELFKKANRKPE